MGRMEDFQQCFIVVKNQYCGRALRVPSWKRNLLSHSTFRTFRSTTLTPYFNSRGVGSSNSVLQECQNHKPSTSTTILDILHSYKSLHFLGAFMDLQNLMKLNIEYYEGLRRHLSFNIQTSLLQHTTFSTTQRVSSTLKKKSKYMSIVSICNGVKKSCTEVD